jgi:hypothetical protein
MKYENITVKETISPTEYQEFVNALVNIQIIDDANQIYYRPEYLTSTLPSILAHFCLDGIEWEEDEQIMYSDELVEKIMADEVLRSAITEIMPSPAWEDITIPNYIHCAMEDAQKRVDYYLNSHRPTDLFVNALLSIMGDLTKISDLIQTDNGAAILKAINDLNAKDKRPQQNRQQRRRRK